MGYGCSCGLPGGMPNSDPDHCVSCCEDGHDKLRAEVERLKSPVISVEGPELKDMTRVCKERDAALLQIHEMRKLMLNAANDLDAWKRVSQPKEEGGSTMGNLLREMVERRTNNARMDSRLVALGELRVAASKPFMYSDDDKFIVSSKWKEGIEKALHQIWKVEQKKR